jgi:hypothetical protein
MKKENKEIQTLKKLEIQVLSALVDRIKLGSQAGYQYGTDRNLYQALGWKRDLEYNDYAIKYDRHEIAKAVIDRPIKATWRGGISLLESDDDENTPLEKEWIELYNRLALNSKFARLDKLTSIGHYGVLLLGLSGNFSEPVKIIKEEDSSKSEKLLYVKPLSEDSAKIKIWEKDKNNPRYGLPLIYDITLTNPDNSSSSQIPVHHSRIIHVAVDLLESETIGTPHLKIIFNRLMDLEKLVGGDAEMFWRNARPGFQGIADKDYQEIDTTGMQDQLDEYTHNLRRFLMLKGIELKSLEQQIADPKNHVHIQLQMISAVTGIPLRILTGSERGELASSQDKDAWFNLIQDRRNDYAEPLIVRPFVDRCIDFGVLPSPEDKYSIIWSDLWAPSEKEKAEVGKIRADALKAWSSDPVNQDTIPAEAFFKFFLGLKGNEVEFINEIRENAVKEESDDFEENEDG